MGTESKDALEEIKEEVEGEETSEDHIGEDAPQEDALDASDGGISEASDDEVEEEESDLSAPQTTTEESTSKAIEFPDTDVKIGYDRLGSVEIKTRTVSTSEDATMEEKEAKKGNNKKEKNKFQSGFKPQKGQKSDTNKDKGGGRAAPAGRLRRMPRSLIMSEGRKEK